MNLNSDIVVGLQLGDEGKGKVSTSLQKTFNYDWVVRFNGGHNAGHTSYIDGKKIQTHSIPFPVKASTKSLIGPGCVVNPEKFLEELEEVENASDMDIRNRLFIAKNAHVIEDKHLKQDKKDSSIGVTLQGNGPCYAGKMHRTNIRAETHPLLKDFTVDPVKVLNKLDGFRDINILFEGAQGFWLDIDHGDYPYVTSSSVLPCSAFTAGVAPQSLRDIYGCAKVYETYSGFKQFREQGLDDEIFDKIRIEGNEIGVTTGRQRHIGWLDLDKLSYAITATGTNNVIFNKIDILILVGTFKLHAYNRLQVFETFEVFKGFVLDFLLEHNNIKENKIIFSGNPTDI
jgi:adenylosuccinate synthase